MQTRPDTDPDAATADTAAGDAAACRRPARATGPAPLLSADLTMEQLMRPLAMFLAILVLNLVIVTYVPSVSLGLLR